jgi:hypothetical protein
MDVQGDPYIVSADLSYHPETGSYRLYITEILKGIFVVEFTHNLGDKEIHITRIQHINVNVMASEIKQKLPYDATFQSIILIESSRDVELKKTKDTILLTTGRFHTFQMDILYDMNSNILSKTITKLYLRYTYYVIQNYIKYHNGLFVLSQILPNEYNTGNQSKQLLTVYNTRG